MTSIVAKIRARELGKNQTTSNFLVWFLNNITVSGTDLYKEQIYRVRDLLCYILELKFGFCMHLKDVTLKIVHETRMSLTVGKQTHDLTVIASDSKTTQSGGDNRKKFPIGAALQVPQNFSFAPL